jgi:hypothetical protein
MGSLVGFLNEDDFLDEEVTVSKDFGGGGNETLQNFNRTLKNPFAIIKHVYML